MSFDPPEANRAFRDKFSFEFPLLCDEDKKMAMAYGAAADADAGYPARAACVIAPDGTVHRYWPSVDAKTFPESVLQELPASS